MKMTAHMKDVLLMIKSRPHMASFKGPKMNLLAANPIFHTEYQIPGQHAKELNWLIRVLILMFSSYHTMPSISGIVTQEPTKLMARAVRTTAESFNPGVISKYKPVSSLVLMDTFIVRMVCKWSLKLKNYYKTQYKHLLTGHREGF